MKNVLAAAIVAVGLMVQAHAAPQSTPDQEAIVKSMDESNAAFLRRDAEALANQTFDRLLQVVGGRSAYIQSLKSGFQAMDEQQIRIVSHTIGALDGPTRAGEYIVYVVPEVTVMESRGRKAQTDGYTLAVRKASGGNWQLIGGGGIVQNPGILQVILPSLPKQFRLPSYSTRAL